AVVFIGIMSIRNNIGGTNQVISPQTTSTQASSTDEAKVSSPLPSTWQPTRTTDANLPPTVIPRKIAQTIDLAPELSRDQKATVWVLQKDGYYRLYLIRPNSDVNDVVVLQPGDTITDETMPHAGMYVNPQEPTRPSILTPTPTINPYP
ncbi:MAG TPA: hypothetical protein VF498_15830, partial [Anaerolineales bacterium]